jgi:hypothetical protein
MKHVEMAAIVGSRASRSATNIRRVRTVLSPPATKRSTTTSSSEVMKTKSAPERTAARIWGQGHPREGVPMNRAPVRS